MVGDHTRPRVSISAPRRNSAVLVRARGGTGLWPVVFGVSPSTSTLRLVAAASHHCLSNWVITQNLESKLFFLWKLPKSRKVLIRTLLELFIRLITTVPSGIQMCIKMPHLHLKSP